MVRKENPKPSPKPTLTRPSHPLSFFFPAAQFAPRATFPALSPFHRARSARSRAARVSPRTAQLPHRSAQPRFSPPLTPRPSPAPTRALSLTSRARLADLSLPRRNELASSAEIPGHKFRRPSHLRRARQCDPPPYK